MSTTIPESVTTTTTTKTTTVEPAVVVPSSTGPTVVAHTGGQVVQGEASTSTNAQGETVTAKLQAAAVATGQALSSAAVAAGHQIAAGAHAAGVAISKTAHDIDAKYHVSDKAADVAAHVGTALKHGNVTHAAKHATTAAAIGDIERAKHEQGPLPEGAHAAPGVDTTTKDGESSHVASLNAQTIQPTTTSKDQPTTTEKVTAAASNLASQASVAASNLGAQASVAASNLSAQAQSAASAAGAQISAAASNLQSSTSSTTSNLGAQASDVSSFAGAAISQGHPVHAAKYATTAAVIGQAERDKHAAGPLENETDIAAKVHPSS